MRHEVKVFEEDIPDNLTKDQEKQLIELQKHANAVDVAIIERNGNKFLRYSIRVIN